MPDTDDMQAQSQQTPFDLSKALADPTSKAAIDAYVIEQKRGLETALNSHKAWKQQFQIGEKDNGEPIYADPNEVKKLLDAHKNGKDKSKTDPDELRTAIDAARESWRKEEAEPLKAENQLLTQRIESLMIDSELQKALIENKIHEPLLEGATMLLRRNMALERDGDHFTVVVRAQDGSTQYGANGRKTIGEMVKEFANTPTGKAYFLYDGSSGGGSGGQQDRGHRSGSGKFAHVKYKSDLPKLQDQAEFMREDGGKERWLSLPDSPPPK